MGSEEQSFLRFFLMRMRRMGAGEETSLHANATEHEN